MIQRKATDTNEWIEENRSDLEHVAEMDSPAARIAQIILDAKKAGEFE